MIPFGAGLRRARRLVFLACHACLISAGAIAAEPASPVRAAVGTVFETLPAGAVTYRHAQVRSINARNVVISHDGGLTSIPLRDLSPDLQAAFGYNPQAEAAEAAADEKRIQEKAAVAKTRPPEVRRPAGTAFDALLQSFGQAPEIRTAGVDLRPKFFELGLNVKNQGPRPSCAVFAIVSALEYQNAALTGQAERFSEEYLVWATYKVLHRTPAAHAEAANEDTESLDGADTGFALSEVVTALRTYGIPLQASLPYTFAKTPAADPPATVIDEARNRRRVSIVSVPGRDQATRIANLVQALNAGTPVAIGLKWPPWRTLRTGYLSQQKPVPDGGHAVTLVGYENKTGALQDTVFIFKNSWGVKWGAGGYGYVTYRYLDLNLGDAAVLDIAPAAPRTMP
jgi:C1A family cysteine protease